MATGVLAKKALKAVATIVIKAVAVIKASIGMPVLLTMLEFTGMI